MAAPMTWEEARDLLKKFRDEQKRCSEEIVELWENVLEDFSYKLDDEIWLVYEQVCIAACDCQRTDIAEKCIKALRNQFPDSLRVKKLRGMVLESSKRFDDAKDVYELILEDDPTNSLVRKRLITVLKEQNNTLDAIKELNKYLESYASDHEAWLELCELYIREQDYSKAAFCMEDLILSNPHNHLYHQRLGEIKYTQGGTENMEQARAYFAQSVKLNSRNLRGLYGFFMAASSLASSQKGKGKSQKDNMKYAAWAAEQISSVYKEAHMETKSTPQVSTVEGMLDALQISYNPSS